MRTAVLAAVTAALLAAPTLLAAAPAGAADAPAKTSKFCRAVDRIDYTDIGNPLARKDAKKIQKHLDRLAKSANGDTLDAIETLSDAYGEIDDGEKYRDVFGDGDVLSSLGTFGIAVGKCALRNLPDITIPDL